MSRKTENYQLNQWEPEDSFIRSDFNEDNAKIDVALGEKSQVVLGTYAGDGEENRIIPLGFTPKAVFLSTFEGRISTGYGGLALPGHPAILRQGNKRHPVVEIVEGGFEVHSRTVATNYYITANSDLFDYHYLALK